MTQVTLNKIETAGFGVFKSPTSFELDMPGLILVTGENRDSVAASSNGSGKTTLFKAISWALFEKTVDGLTTNVVSRGRDKCTVKLTFTVDGKTYRVERTRSKSSGKLKLIDVSDGKPMTQTKKIATQSAIEALIGVDFSGFRCCALFGQGDTARFASPHMTDAGRKAVLSGLLGLDKYEQARAYARQEVEACKALIAADDDEIYDLEASRNKAAIAEARMKGKLDSAERVKKDGEDTLDGIKDGIESLLEDGVAAQAALDKLAPMIDELIDESAELTKLVARAEKAEVRVRVKLKQSAKLCKLADDGDDCPACGRPLEDDFGAKAEAAIRPVRAETDRVGAIVVELNDELDELNDELAGLQRESRKLKQDVERSEQLVVTARRDEAALEERLDKADDETEELAESIKLSRAEVSEINVAIKDVEQRKHSVGCELRAWEFWSRTGFGAKGVPAYAIEQLLPALNAGTNDHLSQLSNGDIEVCWTATTPGSSGKLKEELTCSMTIDGVTGVAPSGGQLRKIELATELALAEIVAESGQSSFSNLFFDEALDGLDATARRHVVSWLQSLPYTTIFLVSHTDEISDQVEQVYTVVKEHGTAHVFAQ